jgi:aspartate 1-decarboxylase
MLRAKIHMATVTDSNINYEGSLTVDETLLDAADIKPYEQVMVSNLNNGERFETYVIPGKKNSSASTAPLREKAQPGTR